MLRHQFLRNAVPITVLASILVQGCASIPPAADPKLASEASSIKILDKDPGPSCQYLGEALSIGGAYGSGFDPFLIKQTSQAASDERENVALREEAKKLGANVVFM